MPSTATVAHRPRARCAARLPPARSICASSQPPKMSPFGLASAGIAMTRTSGWLRGIAPCGPVAAAARGLAACDICLLSDAGMAGRVTIGMAYTYSTLLVCFRASRVEKSMFVHAEQSWLRRVAVAAAAFALVALLAGASAPPSAAQAYDPNYSYPPAAAPSQGYPSYSYPPAAAPSQGYPGYAYPPAAAPSQGYPGYAYPAAYPTYPSYPYSYYPYYPYSGWGWAGWPGWGWGWPVGISVGWGWGGWWGGRGCWNCGFHGGFHGGVAHAGFHGGGFHGGGFHGGGGFGHR